MCDYSLHNVASRPAKVGDKLISQKFRDSITRGFAAIGEPEVAVCLLPGTEVTFEKEVEYEPHWIVARNRRTGSNVAVFRQVNMDRPDVHHDALEFPNGQLVLVNELREGQIATVLQLPAASRSERIEHEEPESLLV